MQNGSRLGSGSSTLDAGTSPNPGKERVMTQVETWSAQWKDSGRDRIWVRSTEGGTVKRPTAVSEKPMIINCHRPLFWEWGIKGALRKRWLSGAGDEFLVGFFGEGFAGGTFWSTPGQKING